MHHFNEESLIECFHELDGKKALGADGIDKETYGKELNQNIPKLIHELHEQVSVNAKPLQSKQVLWRKLNLKHKNRSEGANVKSLTGDFMQYGSERAFNNSS